MATSADDNLASEDSAASVVIKLDEEQTSAFLGALANPPSPPKELRDLMARTFPWDADES